MSHARERGTRRGCAARIFNGASACVRLSSQRDLSRREKKTEEAKRRGERANERNGLFNRELDSMTQVRTILVPFTTTGVVVFFFFFFVSFFIFFFFFLSIKCAKL